jgi:YHS domain-containing protein
MATDPVCGMAVETGTGPHREHDGRTWWFCSTHCRDEFTTTPDRFLPTASERTHGGRGLDR